MTLDEAIEHAQQKAAELDSVLDRAACDCAAEHRQLAEWLIRLKRLERSHLNMSELNSLVCSINDIVERHLGTLDDEKSDIVYNDIVDMLETRLDPDDYPNHN
jgi:hypothetical protein